MSYAGLLAFLFVCCRAGGCGVYVVLRGYSFFGFRVY